MRRRGTAALAGLALAATATGAAAVETSVLVFGGTVTRNTWEEVIQIAPVELFGAGLVGVAGGAAWDLPITGFQLAAELQLVRYFGRQDNWEVNLVPAIVRWSPGRALRPLDSLAFGLGVSYASDLPAVEIARAGTASREKWYWMMEASFGTGREDRTYFLRLHHRSTGNGSFGEGGSTNAVVVGIRQTF